MKFALFAGIGGVILWLVYRQQSAAYLAQCQLDGVPEAQCSLVNKVVSDFKTLDFRWLVLVWVAFFLSNVSRAFRWLQLLEPLGYRPKFANALWTILLGYFANLGLPRMGEVIRGTALSKYEHIPLEKTMGTIVLDRLADMLALLLFVGLAFIFEYQTILDFLEQNSSKATGSKGNSILFYLLLVAVAGVAILWFTRHIWMKLPFAQKILSVAHGFKEGILSIKKLEKPWIFIAHSAFIWLMYYLMLYFCFQSFAPTAALGFKAALMVFVLGTFGIVIPSPGGMGTYHAMIVAGLSLYGISGQDAFSLANVSFFTTQIFFNIVFGILSLLLLPIINKNNSNNSTAIA